MDEAAGDRAWRGRARGGLALSFDLGGGGLRAALTDAEGALHGLVSEPAASTPGGEADPEAWWSALLRLSDRIAAEAGAAFGRVEAVAVAGFTRTQVVVDAAGDPVRPAIGFADSRADALVEEARSLAPPGHQEAARLDAFHPALRLLWLARREPASLARAATVLEPKDFLNARLTGRAATDSISSARLLAAAAGGEGSLLAALGIVPALAPAPLSPLATVGAVRAGLPGAMGRLAGRPVLAMSHDSWAATLGLGALRPGRAYNLTGTTEVFGVVAAEPAAAEGLLAVEWGERAHQLGGPSLAGGDTLLWALSLLAGGLGERGGARPADEAARLLAGPRSPHPLLFLPYLRGERTPWWSPALRGALIGLERGHGPGDALRAVLEGVALLNRVVLDRAEAATGERVAEIRFGGGGAAIPGWAQIKADACGRPVVVSAAAEPGLLGGAMAAFTALGRFPSLAAAQESLAASAARLDPDPDTSARMERLLPLFLRAHDALAPISAALAAEAEARAPRGAP